MDDNAVLGVSMLHKKLWGYSAACFSSAFDLPVEVTGVEVSSTNASRLNLSDMICQQSHLLMTTALQTADIITRRGVCYMILEYRRRNTKKLYCNNQLFRKDPPDVLPAFKAPALVKS